MESKIKCKCSEEKDSDSVGWLSLYEDGCLITKYEGMSDIGTEPIKISSVLKAYIRIRGLDGVWYCVSCAKIVPSSWVDR